MGNFKLVLQLYMDSKSIPKNLKKLSINVTESHPELHVSSGN